MSPLSSQMFPDPATSFALTALLAQMLTLNSALYTLQLPQHFQETSIKHVFPGAWGPAPALA